MLSSIQRQGLTLIELLIAVTILATVAGTALVAFPGLEEQQRQSLRETELRIIARAMDAFYHDTGESLSDPADPSIDNPLDLMALINKPDTIPAWNLHRRRGWRGPYVDWQGRDQAIAQRDEEGQIVLDADGEPILLQKNELLEHFRLEQQDGYWAVRLRNGEDHQLLPTRMPVPESEQP